MIRTPCPVSGTPRMDLQALTDFNLVVAHGGFGRASRASGRAKATLSRRVAELEESLGVRLIERGAQHLRLTEEGHALHDRTAAALAELREAGEAVVHGAAVPRGRLRVSAPMVLAHVALGRIAAQYAVRYPDVRLELVAEDRKVDPVEDDVDLVIRVDPAPDDRLVGRCFLRDRRLIVAHPDFPRPEDKEAPVRSVSLLRAEAAATWRLAEGGVVRELRAAPVLRFSSLLMVRDAVLAGAGAAMLPRLLVAGDVAAGRLALWGVLDEGPVELWALQSSRRLVGAKTRAFLQMVEEAFASRADD